MIGDRQGKLHDSVGKTALKTELKNERTQKEQLDLFTRNIKHRVKIEKVRKDVRRDQLETVGTMRTHSEAKLSQVKAKIDANIKAKNKQLNDAQLVKNR